MQIYLHNSKKSSTFVPEFGMDILSSSGGMLEERYSDRKA